MAVLLIGNGINQNENLACSWDSLLKTACLDDKKRHTTNNSLSVGEKAFGDILPSVDGLTMTLGFDLQEFYAIDHSIAENGTDLKRKIASSMKDRMDERVNASDFSWKKTIHWQIMNLPIDTILTTNYDYALEYAVCPEFKSHSGSRETIYSRYRKHTVSVNSKTKTICHIHGEIHVPRSICLGFEQYSGTLEKIRSDLVRTTRNSEDPSDKHTYHLLDVMRDLKKDNNMDEDDGSWYLKFFKEDIYILGFRMDFSEQDIWWLLDYRIRKMKYEKNVLGITNSIYFLDTDSSCRESEGKNSARNELLRAFGVQIVYLDGHTYDEKYRKAICFIRSGL